MDTARIESLLDRNSSAIMSAGSFAERLNIVYDLLDKEFPQTSVMATIYGPITSMGDFMSRTGIEPLLYAIKQSSQTRTVWLTTDEEVNRALRLIYNRIKQ